MHGGCVALACFPEKMLKDDRIDDLNEARSLLEVQLAQSSTTEAMRKVPNGCFLILFGPGKATSYKPSCRLEQMREEVSEMAVTWRTDSP